MYAKNSRRKSKTGSVLVRECHGYLRIVFTYGGKRHFLTGNQKKTPTCGFGGGLFLGYIPDKADFKQVFEGLLNDFQVQGKPSVIQPISRVLNRVPCFQFTTYNAETGATNPTQTLCFNGGDFVPIAEKRKQQ